MKKKLLNLNQKAPEKKKVVKTILPDHMVEEATEVKISDDR